MKPTPLSIRYNNPGALEYQSWMGNYGGSLGENGRYAQFANPDQGYATMGRVLDTYRDKHGLNTVGGIVNRWAPQNVDNNSTPEYINSVASKIGVRPDQPLGPEHRDPLMRAMAGYEAGTTPAARSGMPPPMGLGGPQDTSSPGAAPASGGMPVSTPAATPSGPQPYSGITPGDADWQRKFAATLMKEGTSAAPVEHWTQGLARLMQAGVGAGWADQARQGERDATADANRAAMGLMGGMPQQTTPAAAVAPQPAPSPAAPMPNAGGVTGNAPVQASPQAPAFAPTPSPAAMPDSQIAPQMGPPMPSPTQQGQMGGGGPTSMPGQAAATPLSSAGVSGVAGLPGPETAKPALGIPTGPQSTPAATSIDPQRRMAALQVINNPYATDIAKKQAAALLSPDEFDTKEVNGTIVRVNKRTGETVPTYVAADKPTTDQQDYRTYFKQESDAGRQPDSFTKWDITRRQASATAVTVDNKSENAEAKARGEGLGKRLNEVAHSGIEANESAAMYQRLQMLSRTVEPGGRTAMLSWIREKTGVALDANADNVQALQAGIRYMTPRMRVAGSGATSDMEMNSFANSLPTLMGTPGGNELVFQTIGGMQQYKQAAAQEAMKWQRGEITAAVADKNIANLPDPFVAWRDRMAKTADISDIPADAIAKLKASPTQENQNFFDQTFGRPGAARKALGTNGR